MLVVYTDRHPPSPTSSPSLCIPTTKTEARMEAGSAWSLPRCVCQLRAYSSLLTPSPPPPPARTFLLAARRPRPISILP